MRVEVRRRAGISFRKTFTLHESIDLVSCAVLQFLALAFADKAFDADFYVSKLSDVRVSHNHRSQIFPWRDEILDIPVFREPVKEVIGVRTSPTLAWKYDSFQRALSTLGRAAGVQHEISAYVLRRATGNVMNEISAHERMQVMTHSSSDTFDRSYLSQHVRRDVQSLYQEQAEHTVLRAAAQMSIYMDSRAPWTLSKKQRSQVLTENKKILEYKQLRSSYLTQIKSEFGTVKAAHGSELLEKYERANLDLDAKRKDLCRTEMKRLGDEYFKNSPKTDLLRQLDGDTAGLDQLH